MASGSESTKALCAQCAQPLEVSIDAWSDDSESDDAMDQRGDDTVGRQSEMVPDDVALPCGDHFHWECLIGAYEVDRCPHCGRFITSTVPAGPSSASEHPTQILVDLHNEGGLQRQIDIFPLLREEAYLRAYPEEAPCRAFLELCREGDYRAVAELLKTTTSRSATHEGNEALAAGGKSAEEILRYQDTLGEMESGLHAAAANGQREVAWLLLLLASEYPIDEFPALIFQEAAALGVMREDSRGLVDIRSLKDARGRTAEDVAREAGVIWNGWIGNGRLAMS